MGDDATDSAVRAALPPVVASLGSWGVTDGRWVPDLDGHPVVWLRTRTEIERVALQTQPWVIAQVRIILTRLSVPYSTVSRLRLAVTSLEAEGLPVEE